MKTAVLISRILVGALFIVSGLVKLNDPLGFSYKLEEYFSPDVLNMDWMMPYALLCSVVFSVLEVALGIAVLAGFMMRLSSWLLLGMMAFFTFLTFYSAYFEKVTECGCFGDALKIMPWHSFWKDVVLLVFVILIFIRQKSIKLNSPGENLIILPVALALIAAFSLLVIDWGFPALFFLVVFMLILNTGRFAPRKIKEAIMAALSLIVASIFCWYCLAHLPLKDYRPFAVGKNIRQQMEIPEGKEAPKYAVDYGLVNKKTGEEKTINSDEYVKSGIWKDDSWEISATGEPYLVKDGYVPPIQDFGIFNLDGDDMSEEVLSAPVCFLVVSKDVNEAAERGLADLNRLAQKAEEKGYLFIGLTPSSYDEVEDFRHRHQLMCTFAMADETMLKTMIRSNTGLILLNKGTIVGKWHYNDFPTFGDLKKQFSL